MTKPLQLVLVLVLTCDKTGLKPSDFHDDLSIREYQISGMCQECQDKVFG